MYTYVGIRISIFLHHMTFKKIVTLTTIPMTGLRVSSCHDRKLGLISVKYLQLKELK